MSSKAIAHHPFYTAAGEWVVAGDVETGDRILALDESYGTVEALEVVERVQAMCDLTVRHKNSRQEPMEMERMITIDFQTGEKYSLPYTSLVGVDLAERYFHRAIMSNLDMRNITLTNANLRGAVLDSSDLSHARLTGAKLMTASLGYANLTSANLANAFLNGAWLEKAILVDANFTGANLHGANLQGANLKGADLRSANLDRALLKGALYDSDTKWPEGFDIPNSGAVLIEK